MNPQQIDEPNRLSDENEKRVSPRNLILTIDKCSF